MGKFVLEGQVISGSNIGDKVFIPRLYLTPSDTRIPFKFQRKQFSLTVSFAMTINKSQGQSLKTCLRIFSITYLFSWSIVCGFVKGYFKRRFEDIDI